MTTYIFPGQGIQRKGMGQTLFDEFEDLLNQADDLLGYSIKKLCHENPNNQLSLTQYAQPAIYTANALLYQKMINDGASKPDYFAGHSLGEYNALQAAGVFDFLTGLKLVAKRGELMGNCQNGGMAAVIGLNENELVNVLNENRLSDLSISNYNTPIQFVVSGKTSDISRAKECFKNAGAKFYLPLDVSGAFHSTHMDGVSREFSTFIEDFVFFNPRFPVISNVTARPYSEGQIKQNLINQVNNPVRWSDSILYLTRIGETTFIEVGERKILTQMITEINNGNKRKIMKNIKSGSEKNTITEETLGSKAYKDVYNLKYAYVAGAMYRGIASKDLVVKMAKAGMMGYFGTGGLDLKTIDAAISSIQNELGNNYPFGMNLLYGPAEEQTVDLFLERNIQNIEAAAYMQITPALVKYRLKGLSRNHDGSVAAANKIQAKISRPEIAEKFLSPAPLRLVNKLLDEGSITKEQADLSQLVPMANALCVESDSAGHTDRGVAYALMPVMINLRDRMMAEHKYALPIHVGSAGGIGTPEAAAAAFVLGADFILTGSINQCTVEADTSDEVKEMLQDINVQDTDYAPAGDMFEFGAKVQVLRRRVFFPARANKLFELYHRYRSIDEIDEKMKCQLQEKYFQRTFDEIYDEVKSFFSFRNPEEIVRAEKNPKHKMALIFRWYLSHTSDLAIRGNKSRKTDYQVHCGPALGAFNQWIKGTHLEDWRNRHVDEIGHKLMQETAHLLERRINLFKGGKH